MDNEISKELRMAVTYLKDTFDLDCTLSEIFALRRYIVQTIPVSHTEDLFSAFAPFYDAVAILFKEYYGIDWCDLYYRVPSGPRKGRYIIGRYSSLVAGDDVGLTVDPAFKEYLKLIQERSYLP